MYDKVQIGQNIEELIQKERIGLRALARKAECKYSTVRNMVRGEYMPDIGRLVRIAKVLKTDLYTLAGIDAAIFMTTHQAEAYAVGLELLDECDGFSENERHRVKETAKKEARKIKMEKIKKFDFWSGY